MSNSQDGPHAVSRELFGLTCDDHAFLFMPGDREIGFSGLPAGATAKQVAKHIRKFVANGGIYT